MKRNRKKFSEILTTNELWFLTIFYEGENDPIAPEKKLGQL